MTQVRHTVSIALAAMLVACVADDVGTVCDGMEVPFESGATFEGDVTRAQGVEIIEFNVEFPCEDPVCVATLARGAYCSRECSNDSHCPDGFSCVAVMNIGPFEGRTFCVWKECNAPSDCGDPWVMGCEVVPQLSLQNETRLCGFR